MEPAGLGDLFKAFDALKKALSKEGLFDPVHKQPLPKYPKKIGVVTSGSSAAFQDIIQVLKRRSPHVEIILKSVSVQGESSALDIADGINEMNQFGQVDVIILGRGGGSLEDLWSFNEEAVARSIFKSDIPIISAVGHETDFTISDFVADLRAPSPSAAAELASIPTEDIDVSLGEFKVDLASVLEKIIERSWVRMDHLETRTSLQQPQKIIEAQSDTVSKNYQRIIQVMQTSQKNFVNKTTVLEKQLIGLGPSQVLNRGYSIAYMDSGEIIRTSVDIEIGDPFTLTTGKGSLGAEKTSDL
jgi:exodeoxyribonuclease VII large subunit